MKRVLLVSTLVTAMLVAPAAAYADTGSEPDGAYINGTVTSTAGPVAEVFVQAQLIDAYNVRVEDDDWVFASTGSDGTYRLGPLDPGRYAVSFASGDAYAFQWWAGATTLDRAQSVTLRATETRTRVDVELSTAIAAVSGTVTRRAGDGTLIGAGAFVEAYTRTGAYVGGTLTLDGDYSFSVAPGTYLVKFAPLSWETGGLAPEYWPDAATVASARAVTVTAGLPTRVDATLEVAPPVQGSLVELPGTALVGQSLTAVTTSDTPRVRFTYQWTRNGQPIPGAVGRSFRITSASAGSIVGVAVIGSAAGHATTTWSSHTAVEPRSTP